jgi:hypothetical protein
LGGSGSGPSESVAATGSRKRKSSWRWARPAVVPSGGDLLDQHAQGQVDAQLADLIAAQVVDIGVGDADRPAGGRNTGELAGMGADKVRFDRRLSLTLTQADWPT